MVACLALTQLALRSERASAAIAESRGVDRLLRLLRPGPSQDITRVALGTLLNLSNHTKVYTSEPCGAQFILLSADSVVSYFFRL
jgi:hypothetical protein